MTELSKTILERVSESEASEKLIEQLIPIVSDNVLSIVNEGLTTIIEQAIEMAIDETPKTDNTTVFGSSDSHRCMLRIDDTIYRLKYYYQAMIKVIEHISPYEIYYNNIKPHANAGFNLVVKGTDVDTDGALLKDYTPKSGDKYYKQIDDTFYMYTLCVANTKRTIENIKEKFDVDIEFLDLKDGDK